MNSDKLYIFMFWRIQKGGGTKRSTPTRSTPTRSTPTRSTPIKSTGKWHVVPLDLLQNTYIYFYYQGKTHIMYSIKTTRGRGGGYGEFMISHLDRSSSVGLLHPCTSLVLRLPASKLMQDALYALFTVPFNSSIFLSTAILAKSASWLWVVWLASFVISSSAFLIVMPAGQVLWWRHLQNVDVAFFLFTTCTLHLWPSFNKYLSPGDVGKNSAMLMF